MDELEQLKAENVKLGERNAELSKQAEQLKFDNAELRKANGRLTDSLKVRDVDHATLSKVLNDAKGNVLNIMHEAKRIAASLPD